MRRIGEENHSLGRLVTLMCFVNLKPAISALRNLPVQHRFRPVEQGGISGRFSGPFSWPWPSEEWRLRSRPGWCGLFHEGVLDAVGLAAELQEAAVVDDSVDDGRGHVVVAEHRSPARKL